MAEHAPGPWIVAGDRPIPVEPVVGYPIACDADAAYFPVAHVFSDEPGGFANAHLIAAAPAMYEALKWAVEYMEQWEGEVMPGWREFQERGRAALAAATGGQTS